MKTWMISLLILALPLIAGAQFNPRDTRTPFERQAVQFSRPGELNMFTLPPSQPVDGTRFQFDSLNLSYQGSWALGQSFSIGCNGPGNIVFIGSGAGVIVMDVSIPSSPVELGEIHTRGLVDAMYFDEPTNRMYLCTYFSGFEIWDVSNFAAPVRLGRGATTGLPRGGIFASGNYVYVVTVADGVQVFDVSDPSSPVNTGNCPLSVTNFAWNSSKSGDYIFVAIGNGGMKVVDVSNPANPHIAGSTPYVATGVCVVGGFAYTVQSNFGLRVFNISNIAGITQAGYKAITGTPVRLKVIGNYAYVSNATDNTGGGVNVVDISTPASPQLITTYSGYAEYITGNGQVVAYTGGSRPIVFLDIADPVNPVLATSYPIPVSTIDVAVSGNYAYSASNGFRVYNVTDKTHPVQVGYDSNDGGLIELAGDHAVYIRESMTANNPVMIMDISNPAAPFKSGQYNAPVMTNDLAIKDHYAFVACWWDGFRVVDFQDPANPVMVAHKFGWYNGAVPGTDYCYVQALDIEGDYLYIVDYKPFEAEDTRGLYIFDISDPVNPVKISRYNGFLSKPYDIDVVGDYACIADWDGGMEVIDVTLKPTPFARGYISLPDAAWSIDVEENHAFLACYINGGVQVVNVADPDNLVIDGYYSRSACFALGVRVDGTNIYLADGAAGFQVYKTDLITSTGKEQGKDETVSSAFPNPFSSSVQIKINNIEKSSQELSVYDASGRLIISLLPAGNEKGTSVYTWNGKTASNMNAFPGFYYYKTDSGKGIVSGKILKIK